MKKLIALVILSVSACIASVQAQTQKEQSRTIQVDVKCWNKDFVYELLKQDKFSPVLVTTMEDTATAIFTNDKGLTLVITVAGNMACVVGAGDKTKVFLSKHLKDVV